MERGAREDETVAFDFKTAYISSKLCIPILSLMPFIYNDHIVANVRQGIVGIERSAEVLDCFMITQE